MVSISASRTAWNTKGATSSSRAVQTSRLLSSPAMQMPLLIACQLKTLRLFICQPPLNRQPVTKTSRFNTCLQKKKPKSYQIAGQHSPSRTTLWGSRPRESTLQNSSRTSVLTTVALVTSRSRWEFDKILQRSKLCPPKKMLTDFLGIYRVGCWAQCIAQCGPKWTELSAY